MGNNSSTNSYVPTEVIKPTGVNHWKNISTGTHTCAIADNDQLYCWGRNNKGQLGINSNNNQSTPTQVISPTEVSYWKYVNLGNNYTCAIADNDQLYCWGQNNRGQIGNDNNNQLFPIQVTNSIGINSWQSVSGGYDHTCGIADNNQVYCWGSDYHGQLGRADSGSGREIGSVVKYLGLDIGGMTIPHRKGSLTNSSFEVTVPAIITTEAGAKDVSIKDINNSQKLTL